MPFHGEWYIPYRVLELRLWGNITTEEIREITRLFVKSLTEVEAHNPRNKSYLLFDTLEVTRMPPLYLMMAEALPVLRFKNRELMVHVSRNKAIRAIMDINAHVTRLPMVSAETREEALRILEAALIKEDLQVVES
jgi:hypothetical protein